MTEPQATTSGEPAISFGPFRLVAAQRLLLEGDTARVNDFETADISI